MADEALSLAENRGMTGLVEWENGISRWRAVDEAMPLLVRASAKHPPQHGKPFDRNRNLGLIRSVADDEL